MCDCFSLAAFKILSLSLTFAILIYYASVWVFYRLSLLDSLPSLYLDFCFLLQVQDVISHDFIKSISDHFLSLSFFWNPYNLNVSMEILVTQW